MVKHVGNNKWSSYPYYAYGKKDPLITPFRTFESFGLKMKIRRMEFRNFVETMMDSEETLWKSRLQHPFLKTKSDIMRNYLLKTGAG